ncbi:MAG: protein serine/threonine phosphatase [Deltaproteobacteria bacterium]|nr:protein serine/threonine phosphatase [Deltaproteobacteria bacterium]
MNPFRLLAIGKSDVGLRRSNNEDAFHVGVEAGFLALADGMGGAAAGEVASRIFVDAAREAFSGAGLSSSAEGTVERVRRIFQRANEETLRLARENPGNRGMGCTAELLAFAGNAYVLGHVGDSRTYLFRGGRLKQETRDHSLVQEQIDAGILSRNDARSHSLKGLISRAVGVEDHLPVDLKEGEALPGDIFLLCSDGLTDLVADLTIQEVLSRPWELDRKVDALIEMAKTAGGHDNVTVILCRIEAEVGK